MGLFSNISKAIQTGKNEANAQAKADSDRKASYEASRDHQNALCDKYAKAEPSAEGKAWYESKKR